MALTPAQRITALESECAHLINSLIRTDADEESLYHALTNFKQGIMWLRRALERDQPMTQEQPPEPELDRTPPDERARVVYPRTQGNVKYWWRWRDKQWVPFSELPEESQVCAMGNGYTVG